MKLSNIMLTIYSILGVTNAFADAPAGSAAAGGTGGLLSMLPMLAILVVFMYFMIIRPQSKRAKEQKNLVSSLKRGDEVLVAGGMLGRIENISDDYIILNITQDVNIVMQKTSVVSILPKGTINNSFKK